MRLFSYLQKASAQLRLENSARPGRAPQHNMSQFRARPTGCSGRWRGLGDKAIEER